MSDSLSKTGPEKPLLHEASAGAPPLQGRALISRDMHVLAAAHQLPVHNAKLLDLLAIARTYEEELLLFNPKPPEEFAKLKHLATEVADYACRDNSSLTLSHRLFLLADSGLESDELARQANDGLRSSDYGTDLGTYTVARKLSDDEARAVLEEYLDRDPSPYEWRHFWAMVGLAAWCSYAWCIMEETRNQRPVPARKQCHQLAESHLTKALGLYGED